MPIAPPSDQTPGQTPGQTPSQAPGSPRGAVARWLSRHLGVRRLVRRKWFWAGVVFALYTLVGFFVAPLIARREIVAVLQKGAERPVALAGVRINPLRLSVEVDGLAIRETDGAPLIGFDRLYVRFSPASLLHWAWTFDEIQLHGLAGTIIRDSAHDSNIGRLIHTLSTPPTPTPPQPATGLPRLIINHLSIVNATATYTDRVPTHPFRTVVGPMTVDVSHLSTLPQKTGEQRIQVALEGGATLEWTSTSGLNPLVSSGHVKAKGPYVPLISRYVADALPVAAPTGAVALDLDYQLATRPDGALTLAVTHTTLSLRDLSLQEQGAQTPFLTVPEVTLTGGHLSWPEQVAGAEALVIQGADLSLRRQADGRIGPAPWLAPAAPDTLPAAPPATAATSPGWAVTLGTLAIKKARLRLDDQTLRQPTTVEIAPLDITLAGLSTQPGTAMPLTVAAGVGPGGTITLQGQITALPDVTVAAKLAIADLPIALAQPYVHDLARLSIEDGHLNAEADIKMQNPDGLILAGHGEVRALRLQDDVENAPVLSWDRLGIDRFTYHQASNEVRISQVSIGGPYLRFQVAKDQSTNFSHLMVARPAGPTPPPAAGPDVESGGTAAAPLTLSVGRIAITQGAADYGDASLPLPFAAHITKLQGDVATLTSATTSPTRVSLRGQVGDFGEAIISGALTPLDPGKNTKINVLFRNVEFPGLSPYTVKFAGRRIARGRLDVDLRYAITDGKLDGANRVVIRDIELGEKLSVPGALNLPLELAIALLKDEDGKINVDLPVSGNINDPQFDIGAVISQAISNLLTHLITAPFEALAGLFGGGGASLDHIDFAPGRADLDPPEREKILHLAQALAMRPTLALVIPGVLDPQADQETLQLAALDAQMTHDLGDHDTVKRQRQMLESLFETRIGKEQLPPLKQAFIQPPAGNGTLDEAGYIAALRDRVAKTEVLGDTALATLAQARAAAVADALKQVPGFDPQRVTLRGSSVSKVGDDGTIPLKLDAESAVSR